jgi:O-antigen/teichoic acid export membrane protein
VSTRRSGLAGTGVASVASATVFAAASGFVVTLLAARLLQPAEYSQFATAWAILYMAVAALNGVQQETARSTTELQRTRQPGDHAMPAVLLLALVVGLDVVVVLFVVPGYAMLADGAIWFVSFMVFFIAGQMLLSGALVGTDRLASYASVTIVESGVRLALFLLSAVSLLRGDLFSLVIYAMVPFLAWFVVGIPTGWVRTTVAVRGEGSWRRQLRSYLTVGAAALVTGLLTTGMPALLSGMLLGADAGTLGTIILVVTLTRAPLMMPLTAFQSTIVAYLVKRRLDIQIVLKTVVAVIGGGIFLAALAGMIGPLLLRWLFGDAYAATGWILFGATFASISLALLFLTGAWVLARGSQSGYLFVWAAGAVGTIGCLLIPFDPWSRTIIALTLGPLTGVLIGVFLSAHNSRDGSLPLSM